MAREGRVISLGLVLPALLLLLSSTLCGKCASLKLTHSLSHYVTHMHDQ